MILICSIVIMKIKYQSFCEFENQLKHCNFSCCHDVSCTQFDMIRAIYYGFHQTKKSRYSGKITGKHLKLLIQYRLTIFVLLFLQ